MKLRIQNHKHYVGLVQLDVHDGRKWGDTEYTDLLIDTVTGEPFIRSCTIEHSIFCGKDMLWCFFKSIYVWTEEI